MFLNILQFIYFDISLFFWGAVMSVTLIGIGNVDYGSYKTLKNEYPNQISGLNYKLASLNSKLNQYYNDKSISLDSKEKLIDNVKFEIASLKINISQLDRTFNSKTIQVISHDHLIVIQADGINRPSGSNLVDVYI